MHCLFESSVEQFRSPSHWAELQPLLFRETLPSRWFLQPHGSKPDTAASSTNVSSAFDLHEHPHLIQPFIAKFLVKLMNLKLLTAFQWPPMSCGEECWQRRVLEAGRVEERGPNVNWKEIWTVDRKSAKVRNQLHVYHCLNLSTFKPVFCVC